MHGRRLTSEISYNWNMMENKTLQESVRLQREELMELLREPLAQLAEQCSKVWPDRKKLDDLLAAGLLALPYGKWLYAVDRTCIQITSNIGRHGPLVSSFGRDRSGRPYMEKLPEQGAKLSDAYISLMGRRPSLTAVQVVRDSSGALLGYIGTDFDLRDLPLTNKLYDEPVYWRQLKGDPSIRDAVFHQSRAESEMDQKIDVVLGVLEELMVYHGVYHVILHFSSNRAVIWVMEDPYRYRLLDIDALIDPDICLAYPKTPYPRDAKVPKEMIRPVLDSFRALRFMDEMFYLRSGTLNLFNGVVGLTFSCDGSHYIPYDEFLRSDHPFWTNRA